MGQWGPQTRGREEMGLSRCCEQRRPWPAAFKKPPSGCCAESRPQRVDTQGGSSERGEGSVRKRRLG